MHQFFSNDDDDELSWPEPKRFKLIFKSENFFLDGDVNFSIILINAFGSSTT